MEGEVEKTVLLNVDLLKQYFQSLIELLNIIMYVEEKVEKKWHRVIMIRENVAQQNKNMKVGDVSARL